jgi:hypothetical protein
MIEGVKVNVSGKELEGHLGRRSIFHKEKADSYQKQYESIVQVRAENPQVSGDPTAFLKNEAASHRQKAQMFAFLAAHIDPEETYRLSGYELVQMEFTESYV